MREEQDTHRSSIDDQNKDFYKLKKKKAKLQGERNDENQNASSERMRREKRTKAHLKGPKKNLTDLEGSSSSSGLYNSSGPSGKKRKKNQTELELGRLKKRERQRKIEASGQPTLGWIQASSLSRPLQASPAPYPGLSRLPDTDPHGSFFMFEAANTGRGSTMLK